VAELDPVRLAELADHHDLSDVLHRYATGLDARDWVLWRSAFVTDAPILFDMRSVSGREPKPQPVDAVISWLQLQFAGFDATQHLITNHRHTIERDGDHARVLAHMRAEHWIDPHELDDGEGDGDRYTMFGYYDDRFVRRAVGWKLVQVQLKLTRTEGNPNVMVAAWRKGKRLAALD
jgi:hypothetical protein